MKRKTEIIFETEELIAVKARRKLTAYCERCQATVEMLTPETVAALTGLSEREIFRLVEKAEIHFLEAERIFVCRNSLQKKPEPPALTDGIKKV